MVEAEFEMALACITTPARLDAIVAISSGRESRPSRDKEWAYIKRVKGGQTFNHLTEQGK